MQAGFLLDYFMSEIAPFACNKGVEDAQRYFATKTDDLPGECFQEFLTYWTNQKGASGGVLAPEYHTADQPAEGAALFRPTALPS